MAGGNYEVTQEGEFRSFRGVPMEAQLRDLAETELIKIEEIKSHTTMLYTHVYVRVSGKVAAVADFMKTATALENEGSRLDLRQR